MITALVQFPIPASVSPEQYREMCHGVAPRFRDAPGLLTKQFLLAEDGRSGWGVYQWASREAAEACYGAEFRAKIRGCFGVDPQITFFETPVVVDNRAGA